MLYFSLHIVCSILYSTTGSIDDQNSKPIRSIIELLWRGLGIKTGVRGTTEFMADLWHIKEGKLSVDSVDIVGYLNGITYNDTETNGIGTFQWGLKKIEEWLFTGTDQQKEDKKKNFINFLFDLRQNIQKELGVKFSGAIQKPWHIVINNHEFPLNPFNPLWKYFK